MTGDPGDTAPYVRLSTGETAPVGVWLLASILFGRAVPVGEPYPCLCGTSFGCERKRNPEHCACHGRTDVDHLGRRCCAARRAGIRRIGAIDSD